MTDEEAIKELEEFSELGEAAEKSPPLRDKLLRILISEKKIVALAVSWFPPNLPPPFSKDLAIAEMRLAVRELQAAREALAKA